MKTILQEYWKILKLRKWKFFSLLLLIISLSILEIIPTLFYKDLANALSGDFSETLEQGALDAIFSILLLYILSWIFWRVFEYFIIDVEAGSMRDLTNTIFRVLQQQKYEFFQNEFSGSIVKKASKFVYGIEGIVDWVIFQGVGNLFLLLGGTIVFFFQSPLFAWYFFIFVVLFLTFAISFYFYQFPFHAKASEMDSKISGNYADSFSNIFTVKTSGKELEEQKIIYKTANTWFRVKRIAWIHMFVGFAVQAFLWISFEIFLNYQMIQEWKAGNLTVGDFILFNSIVLIVMHRLWEFGRSLRNLFDALSDAKEMAEIIAKNDREKNTKNAENFEIKKGEVELRDVCFGYGEKTENLLFNNFTLKINAGEKVALVGASGSGKTTITKLLFRFYEIFSGKILFDGKNSNNILLSSLRSQISLVPQRPELFHRTIKENLLFAKPNASDAEIIEALQKARAFDFVENLSEKMDTLVGERGIKLSGGEAQRIAIARAFLEDSPLVVLDEATSALDSITEEEIQAGIFNLIEKKTSIVIAHRLSTILKMDRIIVMENGKILEEGTHANLISKNGKYAKMWKHQSGGFIGD